jgi:SAM-dependent methyltransferase
VTQPNRDHHRLIREQFTRQAAPFAAKPEHSEARADAVVLEAAAFTTADRVLDVACGPGLLAAVIAPRVRHVTGIDLTPAMIEEARRRAGSQRVHNVAWQVGDAAALPFHDGAFTAVITRYSFHHMPDPLAVLREMARVCEPGGKVIVVDVFTTSAAQQAAYDRIERLRDPSHASALQNGRFRELFPAAGLTLIHESGYRLEMELGALLASSFPNPGDDEKVRQLMAADIGRNETGFEPRRVGDEIRFSFPVIVLVGRR